MLLATLFGGKYMDGRGLRRYMGLPDILWYKGKIQRIRYDADDEWTPLEAVAKGNMFDLVHKEVTYFTAPNRQSEKVVYANGVVKAMVLGFVLALAWFVTALVYLDATPESIWLWVGAGVLGYLPFEIWGLIALAQLKIITELTKDQLRKKADQIVAENQVDLSRLEEMRSRIAKYRTALQPEDMVCTGESKITADTGQAWRVVDVQYHQNGDSPLEHSATITLSSDGQDGITCVMPSETDISDWLNNELRKMLRMAKKGTHTYHYLWNLSAADILDGVWAAPQDAMADIAKLVTSSTLPFAERSTVTVHGRPLPNGHVLTSAIGLDNGDRPLILAPTRPIQVLTEIIGQQLEQPVGHPALTS